MKVIAYVRVSTDRQAERGLGLDVQKRAISAWAKAGGHKIVGTHQDAGVSGSNGLDTRPGLAEAFRELEAGRADALVVYRLDRLARKLASQLAWTSKLEAAGRQVISVSEPDIGNDEMRQLVRQILGAISEYERATIRRRMAAGRALKAERGGYAYGSPPYGWTAVNGELAAVEAEQAVIDRIRELRDGGASMRAIADLLNGEGIPAKRAGMPWHPMTVQRVLERATRAG